MAYVSETNVGVHLQRYTGWFLNAFIGSVLIVINKHLQAADVTIVAPTVASEDLFFIACSRLVTQ